MNIDKLVVLHLSGSLSYGKVQAELSELELKKFFYIRSKHGIKKKTHLWVIGKGYVRKDDEGFWSNLHKEYLSGRSLQSLTDKLGVSRFALSSVFDSLAFRRKTAVEVGSTRLKTNKERYGGNSPMSSEVIKSRLRQTVLGRKQKQLVAQYKKEGYLFSDSYLGQDRSLSGHRTLYKYRVKHVTCGRVFTHNAQTLPFCPYCYPRPSKYGSQLEAFYGEYVESLGFQVQRNSRKIPMGSYRTGEIDVLVPGLGMGFEVNGLYWHSCGGLKGQSATYSNYHRDKTDKALEIGIQLFHIWEHQDRSIIKSMISTSLGIQVSKDDARKLDLSLSERAEAEEFFLENHLHGASRGHVFFSLGRNGKICCCIALKSKGKGVWEIARFCSRKGLMVRGGFSRLLKRSLGFLRDREAHTLVSYADKDWSPDWKKTVYHKVGFDFMGDIGPSMMYTNFRKVFSRHSLQKRFLQKRFPEVFNEDLSANEILSMKRIYPIYNSGNWKFVLSLEKKTLGRP